MSISNPKTQFVNHLTRQAHPCASSRHTVDRRPFTLNDPLGLEKASFASGTETWKPKAQEHARNQYKSGFVTQFETQIDDEVSSLIKQLDNGLDQVGIKASRAIDDISDRFSQYCETLQHAEGLIGDRLADEEYFFTDVESHVAEVKMKLGVRMGDYQHRFESKLHHMQQLWTEWEGMQKDLIGISVEVFGTNIVLDGPGAEQETLEPVNTAQVIYEQEVHILDEARQKLADIQQKIEDLSSRSISESQQHLEDVEVGRQKHLKAVKKAMKNFNTF